MLENQAEMMIFSGKGSCSVLGTYNSYIIKAQYLWSVPIWSGTKNGWHQSLLPPISYAYGSSGTGTQTSTITLGMDKSRNVAINFLHLCMALDFYRSAA